MPYARVFADSHLKLLVELGPVQWPPWTLREQLEQAMQEQMPAGQQSPNEHLLKQHQLIEQPIRRLVRKS